MTEQEIALNLAHRICTKYQHDMNWKYIFNDAQMTHFAKRFLAAIDAERSKEAFMYWYAPEHRVISLTAADHLFDDEEKKDLQALYLTPRARVPEGWQLMPCEPTVEIIEAMQSKVWPPDNYKAMLAAAPTPEDV